MKGFMILRIIAHENRGILKLNGLRKNKGEPIMRNSYYPIIGVIATLMLFFVTKTALAQDVVKVAPEQFKVVLENEHVRVLEFRMKPGDKEAMHTHPATVHIEL